jgi:uncharacterized lipoprotein YddW (UPF0748 family)
MGYSWSRRLKPFGPGNLQLIIYLTFSLMLGLGGMCLPPLAFSQSASNQHNAASILRPLNAAVNLEYRYHLDAIDPSGATNPKGIGFPGLRGEHQLVVYTNAFGASTGTHGSGVELVVENGLITQVQSSGNAVIPVNGFVVSGHGAAANWLSRFGQVGAEVALENPQAQLLIRMTPQVYRLQVRDALQRAQSRPPVNVAHYEAFLKESQDCQAQLQALNEPSAPALAQMAQQASRCISLANMAYYNTFASQKGEFRGAWLRPNSDQPEVVRKVINSLMKAHVNQVFLETYYQGKTIYPSAVMAEYGLQQHPQFQGKDPLPVWIAEAHAAGIKVNLWAQIFFAGNQKENAEEFGPILTRYPQWRNIQHQYLNMSHPMPSQIEPGHFFVDPANPEVRTYLQKLLLEMVEKYEIDGLNLDYIRYPASAPANQGNYLETSWGYTPSARSQFKAMIDQERPAASPPGKSPHKPLTFPSDDPKDLTPASPLWPRWVAWRKSQVSSFVQSISAQAHAIRSNLLVSAVVFPSLNPIYAQKLQDYPLWAREGYIQALTPIGFSTVPASLKDQALRLRAQIQDSVPVYAGIFGMYNRNHPVDLLRQIDAAHQAGVKGVVLFDWSRIDAYEAALEEGPFRE